MCAEKAVPKIKGKRKGLSQQDDAGRVEAKRVVKTEVKREETRSWVKWARRRMWEKPAVNRDRGSDREQDQGFRIMVQGGQ